MLLELQEHAIWRIELVQPSRTSSRGKWAELAAITGKPIESLRRLRVHHPGIKILVHPECPREVNDLADVSGSTGKIIDTVQQSEPGTKWAIGTELHLVNRLKQEHPEQEIHFLSPIVCMCATMYRIDLAHLCWCLENLANGHLINVIEVDDETTKWSLVALERMLDVSR